VVRPNYRVGAPRGGWFQEIFNSDSAYYGGSNVGNYPGLHADSQGCHGRPCSLRVTLPPLATVVFKPSSNS
jgi:1,4-alpha-glucan branching enzyme